MHRVRVVSILLSEGPSFWINFSFGYRTLRDTLCWFSCFSIAIAGLFTKMCSDVFGDKLTPELLERGIEVFPISYCNSPQSSLWIQFHIAMVQFVNFFPCRIPWGNMVDETWFLQSPMLHLSTWVSIFIFMKYYGLYRLNSWMSSLVWINFESS